MRSRRSWLRRGSRGFRDAVDDLWYGEISPDSLDVLDRVLPEQSLQDARNEVNHDRIALFAKHGS